MRNFVRRWTALLGAVLLALPSVPVSVQAAAPLVLEGEYVVITNTNSNIYDPAESTGPLVVDNGGSRVSRESPSSVYDSALPWNEEETQAVRSADMAQPIAAKTYQIGDQRNQYEVVAISDHSIIWMDSGLKSSYGENAEAAAQEIIQVYEGRPYAILTEISGNDFPYQDGSGKLSIMLEVTENGSSGYFSQDRDITAIHINTPETYKKGYFNGTSGLLTHEGQHAIFYWKVMKGISDPTLRWFNEGLSVAIMDYTWGGNDPTGWLEKISGNNTLRKGSALTYSTYRNTTVQDYSMPYLFVRYLISQRAEDYQPVEFIKAVYQVQYNGDTGKFMDNVLAAAGLNQKLPTFSEALKNFYVAAFKQSSSGVDGFYGDPIVKKQVSNYPVAYLSANTEIMLEPTASIVVKTQEGKFTVPAIHGDHITYTPVTMNTASDLSGQGTAADPYRIQTISDLRALAVYPSAFFSLENDLDYTGKNWMSVAEFTGMLEGNGHTIHGLNQPLINQNRGTLQNLNITVNITLDSSTYLGGLASANQGLITDCSVGGTMNVNMLESSMSYFIQAVGGLAGYNEMPGSIQRSYSTVALTIQLSASISAAGNLIGYNTGIIEDSYSAGSLSAFRTTQNNAAGFVGGLIGQSGSIGGFTPMGFRVQNCHSATAVNITDPTNSVKTGTFAGYANSTNEKSTYALSQAALPAVGQSAAVDSVARNKTEAEMKTEATFSGWDFDAVWSMGSKYPELGKLELTLGDISGLDTCFVGEDYNARLSFQARLKVNSTEVPITLNMLEGFNPVKEGQLTVTVNYRGQKKQHTIEVVKPDITSIKISHAPTKIKYQEGDLFDPEGLRIQIITGTNQYLYMTSGFTWEPSQALDPTVKEIKIHYFDQTLIQPIEVTEKIPMRLELINPAEKMIYRPGEAFDPTGLQLRIIYTDYNQSEIFDSAKFDVYGVNFYVVSNGQREAIDPSTLSAENNGKTLVAGAGEAYVEIGKLFVCEPLLFRDQTIEVAAGVDYGSSGSSPNWMILPVTGEEITGGSGSYEFPVYQELEGTLALMFTDNRPEIRGQATKTGTYKTKVTVKDLETLQEASATITVVVTNDKNSAAEFESFKIRAEQNDTYLTDDIEGKIDTQKKTVTLNLPKAGDGTEYANQLIPAFTLTRGTSINVWNEHLRLTKDAYVLTSEKGSAKSEYTIIVHYIDEVVEKNADLKSLSIQGVDIGPFNSSVTEYTGMVAYDVTRLEVTAEAEVEGAVVTITGNEALTEGTNEIVVQVLARDGITKKNYRILLVRQAGPQRDDATLTSLVLQTNEYNATNCSLEPAFNPEVTEYASKADVSVSKYKLTFKTTNSQATVEVSGTDMSEQADGSYAFEMEQGEEILLSITVTAADGINKKTYTIQVERPFRPDDKRLEYFGVGKGDWEKTFTESTDAELTVENDVDTVEARYKTLNPNAEVIGVKVSTNDGSSWQVADLTNIPLNVGMNLIFFTVKAEDGSLTDPSSGGKVVRVDRLPALKSLDLGTAVTLSPAFDPKVEKYTVEIEYAGSPIDVVAEVMNPGTKLERKPEQSKIYRNEPVYFILTSSDGKVTRTYTVTPSVRPFSTDATLKSLSLSSGELSPVFDPARTAYTAEVEYAIESVKLTAEANDDRATVESLDTYPLTVGKNTLMVVVKAEDQSTKKYTIIVIRKEKPKSTIAKLAALTVSEGTLSPAFNPETFQYQVQVDYLVDTIDITGTPEDENAAEVTDIRAAKLKVGSNLFEIAVTAEDERTKQVYTVEVVREQPSDDATLKSLSLSTGSLSPAFSPEIENYMVTVDNKVDKLTISAEATAGVAAVSGTGEVNLAVGENKLDVVVTAQDGKTTKTYTILITRKEKEEPLSSDATLKSLTLSTGSLSPAFSPEIENYAVTVDNKVDKLTISAEATAGVAAVSGTGEVNLAVGENKLDVVVTAQDGKTTKTYTILITRKEKEEPLSSDATLKSLTLSTGSLSPAFSPEIENYAVTVANNVKELKLSVTTNHAKAKVEISGGTALAEGDNTLIIKVTAEDGTVKTYTVIATREALKSNDASLKALSLSASQLYPQFNPEILSYTAEVEYDVTAVDVHAETAHAQASVIATGFSNLQVGENRVTVTVIAEDGTKSETLIIVTRKAPALSSNANLKAIQGVVLNESFDPETTAYTAKAADPGSIQILGIAQEEHAQVSAQPTSLEDESVLWLIRVTAQDGTVRDYTVTITKEEQELSHEAFLVSLDGLRLNPGFDSGIYQYSAEVEANVTSVALNAAASEKASVQISGQENLHEGVNSIVITVVAEDNSTSTTYTITVTRKSEVRPNAETQALLEKLISMDKVNEGSMPDFIQLHKALTTLPEDQKSFFYEELREKLTTLETLAAQINHQSSGASVENIPWSVALRIEELTKSAAENYLGSILGGQEILYGFELSFINRAEQDSPWQPESPVIVRLERKIDTNTYKDIKLYAILNGAPEQQALTLDAGSLRIISSGSSPFIVTGTRQEAQKPQEEETKADTGSTPAASAAPQPSAKPAIKAAVSPKPTTSPEITPEVSAQPEPSSPSAATPQPSLAPEATQVPEAKQNSSSLGEIGIAILVILAAGGCFFVIKRKQ